MLLTMLGSLGNGFGGLHDMNCVYASQRGYIEDPNLEQEVMNM